LTFVLILIVLGVLRGVSRIGSDSSSVPSNQMRASQQALEELQRHLALQAAQERLDPPPGHQDRAGEIMDLLQGKDPVRRQMMLDGIQARELDDPERGEAAAKNLADSATEETIPTLIKALGSKQARVRDHIWMALERLRSPNCAAGVARLLTSPEGESAVRVLRAIGPAAEPHVRPYLEHTGFTVRLRACRVLEKIGTHKSLADLRLAKGDAHPEVRLAAGAAIDAIEKRGN
jgi:HEAT repeat protein